MDTGKEGKKKGKGRLYEGDSAPGRKPFALPNRENIEKKSQRASAPRGGRKGKVIPPPHKKREKKERGTSSLEQPSPATRRKRKKD